MADAYKIEVHKRDELRSRDVRNLRKEGKIPGVYYSSESKSSIPFYMIDSELLSAFKSGAHLYQVSVGGKLRNVIFKEVQYHPVTDDILHVDIYGVSLKEKIDLLLNKVDELKVINDSLKTKNDYLINVNKDLEAKIKVIQAKEKQLKLVSAITEDNTDKQYFKNKIDYLIKEIDYCIDRISI